MDAATADIDRRIERAKLEAMKELAYGASHEINNPLANISARAQTLLRDEEDPDRRRALQAIQQQAMRAHEMISDLMLFARPPQIEPAEIDARELVSEVAGDFASACAERSIQISTDSQTTPLLLRADPQHLRVALNAAIRNSLEAIGHEGKIELKASTPDRPEQIACGDWAACCIEVRDDGPGFSDVALERGLDPFFSGREAGRGLGFGLSKCWRIVTLHGGDVRLENLASGGARIAMLLPAEPPPADASNA